MRKSLTVSLVVCISALSVLAGGMNDRALKAEFRDLASQAPAVAAPFYEIVYQIWDNAASSWLNSTRTALFYKANGDLAQQRDYLWTGTAWKDDTLRDFYVNKWGDVDSIKGRKMVDGSGWIDYERVDVKFTSTGGFISELKKNNLKYLGVTEKFGDTLHDSVKVSNIFKGPRVDSQKIQILNLDADTTGQLVNEIKFWIRFNLKGQNDLQRIFVWDTATDVWIEAGEHRLFYDTKGNRDKMTTVLLDENGGYIDYRQILTHYTAFNAADTVWTQTSPTGQGFKTTEIVVTTYNAKQKTSTETVFTLVDTIFENTTKTEYQYDSATSTELRVVQYSDWDGNEKKWKFTRQELYGYTPVGVQKHGVSQQTGVVKFTCSNEGSGVVRFTIDGSSKVSLTIYDLKGTMVKSLLDNAAVAGTASIDWDGTSGNGTKVGSGSLICRLMTPGGTCTRQIIVTK